MQIVMHAPPGRFCRAATHKPQTMPEKAKRPAQSIMLRNVRQKMAAVCCGTDSKDMTNTIPTIRSETTSVSANKQDHQASIHLTGKPCVTAKSRS